MQAPRGRKVTRMSVDVLAHLVRIHINREAYDSPNPTTGEHLYGLA